MNKPKIGDGWNFEFKDIYTGGVYWVQSEKILILIIIKYDLDKQLK